jgi:hypothetical protein
MANECRDAVKLFALPLVPPKIFSLPPVKQSGIVLIGWRQMAGDIFFTDQRVWSSNSIGFVDMMERSIKLCRDDEALLVSNFSQAMEVRCLGLNLCKDRDLRIALTERMLEAASKHLQELHANPDAHPVEVKAIEELVNLAQEQLKEWGRNKRDANS